MRRLSLATLLLALVLQASAQEKETPDEPVLPEKLDKVTLTLNAGGHTATVVKVFFTPDSKQLITLSHDHSIRIWDVATWQTRQVLRPPGLGGLGAAALSSDGQTLAVASQYPEGDKTIPVVYLFDLTDGQIRATLRGHTGQVRAVAMSADGKRLATSATLMPILERKLTRKLPRSVSRKSAASFTPSIERRSSATESASDSPAP